ncbi:MAG: hypothetical protein JWM15_391, partial [Cryptosporangiaceae bacterium]|nr:hypothetical protein [Cryptosporangiaceae bacterium]
MTTGASGKGDVPREELSLPDYDHLPIGSLEHRVRTLDVDGLERLLAYEEAHAHRLLCWSCSATAGYWVAQLAGGPAQNEVDLPHSAAAQR